MATEALSLLDQGLSLRGPDEAIAQWLKQVKMIEPDIKDGYEVSPMPEGWTTIDSLIEIESTVGKEKMIVIEA